MTLIDTPPAITADRSARRSGGVALVAAGLLGVVSTLTQPAFGHSPAERLALLDAAGAKAGVSTATLTLMQLFLIAGLVGLGALLRPRAPRLAAVGTALAVVGAFGESVSGGQSFATLAMAHDAAHRSTYAGLLHNMNSSPVGIFSLLGLAGSVLGLLLLSIAVFRTRTGPTWTAPALWVFLALEYVGQSVLPALAYVAAAAGLVAFVALARELVKDR